MGPENAGGYGPCSDKFGTGGPDDRPIPWWDPPRFIGPYNEIESYIRDNLRASFERAEAEYFGFAAGPSTTSVVETWRDRPPLL